MQSFIANNPLLQQLIARYNDLTERDQLALKILSVFAAILLLVYMVLIPAANYKNQAEQHYLSSLDTLHWIQSKSSLMNDNKNQRSKRDPGQSLLGIANQTSKTYRLSFRRYQPVGENGLSLWLNTVSFNDLILWLERIDKRYGITVQDIAIERDEQQGLVNVRLVLQG